MAAAYTLAEQLHTAASAGTLDDRRLEFAAVAKALGGNPPDAPLTPEKILDLVHSLGKEA